MPLTNTCTAIAGALPSPHTTAFLKWVDTYLAIRKNYCVFRRATTYFIDPVNGNDSWSGLRGTRVGVTTTGPWKTLTNVRNALAGSGSSGTGTFSTPVTNTAFLFKRGTVTRDYVGLVIGITTGAGAGGGYIGSNKSNTSIKLGAYGPLGTTQAYTVAQYTGNSVQATYSYGSKPQISNFTVQFPGGTYTWTRPNAGTYPNMYQVSLPATGVNNPSGATNIGWLRLTNQPFVPFTYVSGANDAASYALVNSTPMSFFVDSSNKLNINLNNVPYSGNTGIDPSSINLEATPYYAVAPSGIQINPGSDKIWVDGLWVDGWGCQSLAGQAAYGIQISNANEEVAYISNCDSYYNGRHAISHLSAGYYPLATGLWNGSTGVAYTPNGTGGLPYGIYGGTMVAENCSAGYCSPVGGSATFNTFSNQGLQETTFLRCIARFGMLPCNSLTASSTSTVSTSSTAAGQIDRGQDTFFGHTGNKPAAEGGANVNGYVCYGTNLYLNIGCRILDERATTNGWATVAREGWQFADVGSNQTFLTGTATDPTTYRCFVIGWESPRYRTTPDGTPSTGQTNSQQTVCSTSSRFCFINCRHYYRKAYTGTSACWAAGNCALWINSIFEIETEDTTQVQYLFGVSVPPTISPRFLNCAFILRGDGGTAPYTMGLLPPLFGGSQAANYNGKGIYMGNCVLISMASAEGANGLQWLLSGPGYTATYQLVQDSPNLLRYIATSGAYVGTDGSYSATNSNVGGFVMGFGQATGLVNLDTPNSEYPLLGFGTEPDNYNSGLTAHISSSALNTLTPTSLLVGAGSADPFYDTKTTIGMLPAPQYDMLGRQRPSVPAIGPFDLLNNQTMIVVGGILVS